MNLICKLKSVICRVMVEYGGRGGGNDGRRNGGLVGEGGVNNVPWLVSTTR